nr:MAG TPA: MqsA [Caudoviricetes sp.]
MLVICDQCNHSFTIEKENIRNILINDIEVTYLECKECNHKYVISCIDEYIMKEQRRYQKLIRDNNKGDSLKCLMNMKVHSNRLKNKIINNI